MAFALKNRVKDTTTTTGTGTLTLSGSAPTGFQAFSAIGNGNSCPYTIVGGSEWEVGIGTYTSSGTTLSRTTVLASSNSGSLVSFSAGTKDVFVTLPAELVGYQLIATLATTSGSAVSFTSIPATYSDLLVELIGVSHNSGSNQYYSMELSADGSSFTSVQSLTGFIAASAVVKGGAFIPGYRNSQGVFHGLLTPNAAPTISASGFTGCWALSGPVTTIRLTPSGGSFDAGSVKLWGRL